MKIYLRYFKKYKKHVVLFVCISIIATLLNILEPKFTANMLSALTEQNFNNLLLFAVVVAGICILQALIKKTHIKLSVLLNTKVGVDLSKDICTKATKIKYLFLYDFKSGELQEITSSDPRTFIGNVQEVITLTFSILRELAIMLFVFILNWQCGLLFMIFIIIIMLFQKFSLKKEKEFYEKAKIANDNSRSIISQIFKGMLEIKVLNLKNPILEKYESTLYEEADSLMEKELARASNRYIQNISFQIYTLAFVILAVFMMKNSLMTVSAFITIFMYKSQIYSLIFDIADLRSTITVIKVSVKRMNRIMKIENYKLEDFGKANTLESNKHSVKASNVSIGYGEETILEDFTLELKSGEVCVIAGDSGCGKTTLAKVFANQHDPSKGEMLLDNIEFSKYSEEALFSTISLSSQEPFIFSSSIRENLMMIGNNPTEAMMWKALEEANLLDFVKSLPKGLDTIITENSNISGGQKQRLALARIFLKNTPIIILDECTSALDNKSQAEILKTIKEKARTAGTTFLVIAHRIEAIKEADRIVFISGKKIKTTGTFENLLQDEEFRKLLNEEK